MASMMNFDDMRARGGTHAVNSGHCGSHVFTGALIPARITLASMSSMSNPYGMAF
jgi:hypothetical protein